MKQESNRQPKFAPSIALTPERIATDLSQATLLAHKLDAEAGSEPFDVRIRLTRRSYSQQLL